MVERRKSLRLQKEKGKRGTIKVKGSEVASKLDSNLSKCKDEAGRRKLKGKEKVTSDNLKRKRVLEEDSDFDEPNTSKTVRGSKRKTETITEENIVEKRDIKTRTSPKSLTTTMLGLSQCQKDCLDNFGFGSLVRIRIDALPWKLGYFVVDSFDEKRMQMKLKWGMIKISQQSVFEIIGDPIGGKPIESLEIPKEEDEVVEAWRKQFEKKEMTAKEVMNCFK